MFPCGSGVAWCRYELPALRFLTALFVYVYIHMCIVSAGEGRRLPCEFIERVGMCINPNQIGSQGTRLSLVFARFTPPALGLDADCSLELSIALHQINSVRPLCPNPYPSHITQL